MPRSGRPFRFSTMAMRARPPAGARNHVYLEVNGWNDYGFRTMWNVWYVDSDGALHAVGGVRIGAFDLGEESVVGLPDTFTCLPEPRSTELV